MNNQLKQALTNINIVIQNARMTAGEHEQLKKDMELIVRALEQKSEKKESKKKDKPETV